MWAERGYGSGFGSSVVLVLSVPRGQADASPGLTLSEGLKRVHAGGDVFGRRLSVSVRRA